jgi:tRNA-2-methylthio-N6-dimethylallyladenosine synthase
MNEYDSDLVSQLLLNMGYLPASDPLEADLVLINTCSVRARAEQKAFSMLGRIIKQKGRSPNLKVGIMGCVAQQRGDELFARFPGLDLVLGTREISRAGTHLLESLEMSKKVAATDLDLLPPRPSHAAGYFRGRYTGYVAIMEGCDNFCTYCVVPLTRGRERSRPPEEILEETVHLISEGIREVTLLGQNVNSYSYGSEPPCRFPALLRRLSPLQGLLRIRFTTSHPKDLSDDLIRCFTEIPNLCRHIHLPFQSGSDRILKRMNRGYNRSQYMARVEQLRQAVPSMAITADVMVGFPGESEADFEQTMDLIRKIEFDNLYSFKYSDRDKTRASTLREKIDEEVKSRRLHLLQRTQREITLRKNRQLIGSSVEVLVEGFSRKGNQLTGRTEGNRIVNFAGNPESLGCIVKVRIKDASANSLRGEYGK